MERFTAIRNAFALFILAICVGCAMNFGLKNRIAVGHDAVTAYTNLAISLRERQRITIEQAEQASSNAKRAKAALDFAAGFGACPAEPCTPADQLMVAEKILMDLEKELKAKEGK
jgi:hypothetical protein